MWYETGICVGAERKGWETRKGLIEKVSAPGREGDLMGEGCTDGWFFKILLGFYK